MIKNYSRQTQKKNFFPYFFLSLLALSVFLLPFKTHATDGQATVTYFQTDTTTPGETNATYTTRVKFNQEYTAGENAYIWLKLERWHTSGPEIDQTANITNPTGNLSYVKFVESGNPLTVTLEETVIDANGAAVYKLSPVSTDIPANTEIEIRLTGVKNPAKAGTYGFAIESDDHSGTNFSANRATYPYRITSLNFGTPCIKVKVLDYTGTVNAAGANVSISDTTYSVFADAVTDYLGVFSVFNDGWNDLESCPTDEYLFQATICPGGTAESEDWHCAPETSFTLPDDQLTYYNDPIKLSSAQLTGRLIDGSLGGDAVVSFAPVVIHPVVYSDPNEVHRNTPGQDGIFVHGGLTAGNYVLSFESDQQSNSQISPAEPITGIVVDADGKVTVPGYCETATYKCDLGDITYPVANKIISGTVKKESGATISNGSIWAFKEGSMTMSHTDIAEDGSYTLRLGSGSWNLNVQPGYNPDQAAEYTYCGMPKMFSFADNPDPETRNSSNTGGYTDFTVRESTATVIGKVIKPNGDPFSQGEVQVRSQDGCGDHRSLEEDGTFAVTVPAGTFNVVIMNYGDSAQVYGAPSIAPITLSANETENIGTVTMIEKKDTISGRIYVDVNDNGEYDSGEARSAVRVEAFKMTKKFDEFAGTGGPMGAGEGGFAHAESDQNGLYTLYVVPGMWMVNLMMDPGMTGGYSTTATNYIYDGMPLQVSVENTANGNNYSNRDFIVKQANSSINGILVDTEGNGVSSIAGFAFADSGTGPMAGMGMGTTISSGTFSLKVPAGTYEIGIEFPPLSSGYSPSESKSVTVTAGETKSIEIEVKPNNSRIQVNFVDTNGEPITNLSYAEIFTENSNGGHMFQMLYGQDLAAGSTTLQVCEGSWRIGYFIDPTENNYMSEPISKDNEVIVTTDNDASNPAEIDITLREIDSAISGTITDPNGTPLSDVWVTTDNRKAADFDLSGPMLTRGSTTDTNGEYQIDLPAGTYKVQAFLPTSAGYLNPRGQEVTIDSNHPGTVDLQFLSSDAVISGTVYLEESAHGAFITAYSENDGYNETTTSDGSFSLNVTSDDTWYLKAVYESDSGTVYRSEITNIDMTGLSEKTQNLSLEEATYTLPQAIATTFDYQNAKKITLSDGFTLSIPATTIEPSTNASGNNITITISPTAQLSSQNKSIPISFGYDITAIDDSGTSLTSAFNSPVTITVPYTEDQLTDILGSADEDLLDNGYWDTATSTWKGITGANIDTENNTVSFTVNHFTVFTVLSGSELAQSPITTTPTPSNSPTSTPTPTTSPTEEPTSSPTVTTAPSSTPTPENTTETNLDNLPTTGIRLTAYLTLGGIISLAILSFIRKNF